MDLGYWELALGKAREGREEREKGSGIIYSKYLNSESAKGYVPIPIHTCAWNCWGAGCAATSLKSGMLSHPPQHQQNASRGFQPCWIFHPPLQTGASLQRGYSLQMLAPSLEVPVLGSPAHLPLWAGKQAGCEALTLPPNFCSTSRPLPALTGRLRALHKTERVRGGGYASLEVAPAQVMRGWPGHVADPGSGRCWSRCCSHSHPKGNSGGRLLLLPSPGVWSPPASPPALQAPA